jgi:tetratricopeptide (TPR) repeat protein
MAYAGKGDYDHAVEDYSHALRLRPGFGMAEGGLAEAKAAKARLAGGQKLGDPRAWCKGKALPQEGFAQDLQISGCTTLIKSGRERRNDLAEDYFNRASARDFGGDATHAIADFAQAIRLNPGYAEAHFRLGSIYWVKGDYNRAASYLTRAVKLKPNTVLYLRYRGYARYGKNQFGRAIADFSRVIKLQPDDAEAFLKRSLSYIGQGDYDRALADCHQAIRLSRTSEATEGHNSCGNAYFRKVDMENAILDFDAALKLWPEYPEALYGRGCAKVRSGDVVGGQSDMEQARKFKPEIETVEAKLGIKP